LQLASPKQLCVPAGHPYSDFVLNSPKHLFQRSLRAARLVFPRALDSVHVSCESSLLGLRTWPGCTPAMRSKQVKANLIFFSGIGQGAEMGPKGRLLDKLTWTTGGLPRCAGEAAPWAGRAAVLRSR